MSVEEVHNHTLGLVQGFRPAALRPPLSWGRGKVRRKFGALEERAEPWRSSEGKSPLLVSMQSRPGESLRTRNPCGLKERSHLRSAREVEGVGKAWRRGRMRRAGHGGKRSLAAEGDLRRHRCAGFLGDAVKSGLPRPRSLSRSLATGLGLGRNALVGQVWEGKKTCKLLPPQRGIPSSKAAFNRSAARKGGREGTGMGSSGEVAGRVLGSPPFPHGQGLVSWAVSARHPTRGTPQQRSRKKVPSRWDFFNIVVAIIGCFYWGLEPQMAVCGELGVDHLAFLVVV